MKINLNKSVYPFIFKHFRTKRMRLFASLLKLKTNIHILDVGGTALNWSLLAIEPQIILLNIGKLEKSEVNQYPLVLADGQHLPFARDAFDIVFSNSVIEHLSDLHSQILFATECQRVGRSYFIQTPSKWFPIEPHYLTIGIHWLPKIWQIRLLRTFSLQGLLTRAPQAWFEMMIAEIRLLTAQELHQLFPDGQIIRECFLGWTKSIIVYRIKD